MRDGGGDDPVLDRDRLDAITGGSAALAHELLALLIDEARGLVAQIRGDPPLPEADRTGDLIHALKGIAGNLGAARLHHAAEAVERADLRDALTRRGCVTRLDEELAALTALG